MKFLIFFLFMTGACFADIVIEKARSIAHRHGLEVMSEGHRIAFYNPRDFLEQEAAFYFVKTKRMPFDFAWREINIKVITDSKRKCIVSEFGNAIN